MRGGDIIKCQERRRYNLSALDTISLIKKNLWKKIENHIRKIETLCNNIKIHEVVLDTKYSNKRKYDWEDKLIWKENKSLKNKRTI